MLMVSPIDYHLKYETVSHMSHLDTEAKLQDSSSPQKDMDLTEFIRDMDDPNSHCFSLDNPMSGFGPPDILV